MQLAPLVLAAIAASPAESIAVHAAMPGDHVEPAAAFSSAGLVVTWVVRRPGESEVVAALSTDLATFSSPISVSGKSGSTEVVRPHVSASGDKVAIVWSDASHGDHDVYLVTSSDGGRTFGAPMLAAGGAGGQIDPRVLVEPGSVSVAFHDSFGSAGGDNKVVWRIRSVTSLDGRSFGGPIALGSPPARERHDLFASLAGLGTPQSPLAIAWLGESSSGGGPNQVLVAQSIDEGQNFAPELRIDRPGVRSMRPRIAAMGRGFVIVFDALLPAADQSHDRILYEEGEYLDVLAVTSTTAGRTFGRPFVANQTRALHQSRADVAASGEKVAIVWVDHAKPGVRRIVLRSSEDSGQTFSDERVVSDDLPTNEVDHPSVAVKSDVTVVVFEDGRGGAFHVRAAVVR